MDHCISVFKKKQEDKLFRIYVTDCLKVLTSNTTHYVTSKGMEDYGAQMKERWIDIITPKKVQLDDQPEEDLRSCKEIVSDMWKRIKKEKLK